eukprot:gene9237-6490_t
MWDTNKPKRNRKRRCDFTSESTKKAYRFGAPCCVVDPLLSLLADVNRLRDCIMDTLTHVGARIPRKCGDVDSSFCYPADELDRSQECGEVLQQYPTTAALYDRTEQVPDATLIKDVMMWVEDQHAMQHPRLRQDLHNLMCSSLSAIDGKKATLRVEPEEDFCTDCLNDKQSKQLLGCLCDADVLTLTQHCKFYEKKLKSTSKLIYDFFHSSISYSMSQQLLGNAKRVQFHNLERPCCSPPSLVGAISLVEQRVKLHDSFSFCHKKVHSLFLKLSDELETFLDEAEVIHEREKEFWNNMKHLEMEYDVLRDVSKRVQYFRHILSSLRGSLYFPLYFCLRLSIPSSKIRNEVE